MPSATSCRYALTRRRALVALLACVSASLVASTGAQAACRGASCVHKNPRSHGCSATTIDRVQPPGGGPVIELRWSRNCVANWARFADGNGASPGYWNYWVETRDGRIERKLFNGAYWTYMVNGYLWARACVKGLGTHQANCTGWH